MTNLPENLNDYNAWIDKGNIKEAMDALKNQVTFIVGNEQTAQMLVKKLRDEQGQRDEVLAGRLEQIVFTLKGDFFKAQGQFQEQFDLRFGAYSRELDVYREQHKALLTLVEERLLAPFGEMVQRVSDLEYDYADLADRLDAALDPGTPGATIEMVVLQDRVAHLTRLILAMFVVILLLGGLLLWHHYFIWERLR